MRKTPREIVILDLEVVNAPFGTVRVMARDGRLCAVVFEQRAAREEATLRRRFGDIRFRSGGTAAPAAQALVRYLDGELAALDAIPVDPGGTPFQQQVWAELRRIPSGTTISYGELADRIENPRAVRAVGLANGSNPVSIFIPCHRVIGATGDLTGYGGGLDVKRWLLRHEGWRPSLRPPGERTARLPL